MRTHAHGILVMAVVAVASAGGCGDGNGSGFDDNAGVIHLYAPMPVQTWDVRFPELLKEVAESILPVAGIDLGFESEMYSFYLIVRLVEDAGPDWAVPFLSALEARVETGMGSGTSA